jgi:hypothetical protein
MVGKRAAQLVAEQAGLNGIKHLYIQAAKLQNPAFLGWVVEADYFERCKENKLTLVKRTKDKAVTCKPTAWTQGGYDVVHIEKDPDTKENSYHLRFGQVTVKNAFSEAEVLHGICCLSGVCPL